MFGHDAERTPTPRPTPPKRQADRSFTVTASDGVVSQMRMWSSRREDITPVKLLFVPGAAVDERIFSLDTIATNAIEYFTRSGYTCYTVTHRLGLTPNAKIGFTTFDARLDLAAALAHVREEDLADGGDGRIYCVVHCLGSLAFCLGLLSGDIPSEWVRALTVSQVFMHPLLGMANVVKAALHAPSFYRLILGRWFDCDYAKQRGIGQWLFSQLLRLYPVGRLREFCTSTTCHRSELAFGRLWSHPRLNKETHDALPQLLGGTTMAALSDLARFGLAGRTIAAQGAKGLDIQRLRGIPMLIIGGADNVVFRPAGTAATYRLLCETFGPEMYERMEFKGRGHLDCWMGDTAAAPRDVYATVLDHVHAICRKGAIGTGANGESAGDRVTAVVVE